MISIDILDFLKEIKLYQKISTIVGYLIPDIFDTYILHIYVLVWFGLVIWYINHCRLSNAKSIFIHINSSFKTMQFSVII